ncbi:hypothetical protein V8E36_003690 [Tilletia maclaganii]
MPLFTTNARRPIEPDAEMLRKKRSLFRCVLTISLSLVALGLAIFLTTVSLLPPPQPTTPLELAEQDSQRRNGLLVAFGIAHGIWTALLLIYLLLTTVYIRNPALMIKYGAVIEIPMVVLSVVVLVGRAVLGFFTVPRVVARPYVRGGELYVLDPDLRIAFPVCWAAGLIIGVLAWLAYGKLGHQVREMHNLSRVFRLEEISEQSKAAQEAQDARLQQLRNDVAQHEAQRHATSVPPQP